MSVYVDDFNIQADVLNGSGTIRGIWCHMTADTHEELIIMAGKIGLKRSWIQKEGTWQEHFDVTLSKRKLAVLDGAIEVSFRENVMTMMERWEKRGILNRKGKD